MRCDAYSMAMLLKLTSKGDKRLHVSTAANDLDDDVELDGASG